jgi:hypothetical protein
VRVAGKIGRPPSPALVVAAIALVASLAGTALAGPGGAMPDRWKFPEPFHPIGAAGEPAFSVGGQGDCVWANAGAAATGIEGLNPAAFYRDPVGEVHLVGVARAQDAGGGDGACGGGDTLEDLVVFVLPPGYRPENVTVPGRVVVVPEGGAEIDGESVPGGAVLAVGGFGAVMLDGIAFRAAGPDTRPIAGGGPDTASLRELRALAH